MLGNQLKQTKKELSTALYDVSFFTIVIAVGRKKLCVMQSCSFMRDRQKQHRNGSWALKAFYLAHTKVSTVVNSGSVGVPEATESWIWLKLSMKLSTAKVTFLIELNGKMLWCCEPRNLKTWRLQKSSLAKPFRKYWRYRCKSQTTFKTREIVKLGLFT